jgi:ankyrin repeat protein
LNQKTNISISILLYLLTQDGFDVNVKDHDGCAIIHWVCYNINILPIDVFMCLIETKRVVDINGLDEQFSPVYGGDVNIITYLPHQDNLNINIRDKNDLTKLYWVC